MPLFMDVHRNISGLTAEAAADAHEQDLVVQKKHGANFVNYWINTDQGAVFCLCEAPDKKAVEAVHREAHGLMADEVFEVSQGT